MTQTVWRKKRKLSFLPCIKQKKKKRGGVPSFCLFEHSFLLLSVIFGLNEATCFVFVITSRSSLILRNRFFLFHHHWSRRLCGTSSLFLFIALIPPTLQRESFRQCFNYLFHFENACHPRSIVRDGKTKPDNILQCTG